MDKLTLTNPTLGDQRVRLCLNIPSFCTVAHCPFCGSGHVENTATLEATNSHLWECERCGEFEIKKYKIEVPKLVWPSDKPKMGLHPCTITYSHKTLHKVEKKLKNAWIEKGLLMLESINPSNEPIILKFNKLIYLSFKDYAEYHESYFAGILQFYNENK